MRARFNHEGALDHHAHNEHEVFRRADEALDRQRRLDHAAKPGETIPLLGGGAGIATLESTQIGLTSTSKAIGASTTSALPATPSFPGLPQMPHEQMAASIGASLLPQPPIQTTPTHLHQSSMGRRGL